MLAWLLGGFKFEVFTIPLGNHVQIVYKQPFIGNQAETLLFSERSAVTDMGIRTFAINQKQIIQAFTKASIGEAGM